MSNIEQNALRLLRLVNYNQAKWSTKEHVIPGKVALAARLDSQSDDYGTVLDYLLDQGYFIRNTNPAGSEIFRITPAGMEMLGEEPRESLLERERADQERERADQERQRAEELSKELEEARRPWWRRMFGG